ncbi:MAG: hypothetical protein IKS87_04710 [Lachnospiraceae bacterium]|nr:hypothetical protein [Lachnospiraceae bacterium]
MTRISVDRSMGESYLVAEEENKEREGRADVLFEVHMLTENRIDGLLPLQVRSLEGNRKYLYPLSGMVSLRQAYDRTEMRADTIAALIKGVQNALGRAEEYMLQQDHLLFDPAYVFIDPLQNRTGLCCLPLWEGSLREGLHSLAEFLIARTDHGEDAAIDLSYNFYRQVMTGDFIFEDTSGEGSGDEIHADDGGMQNDGERSYELQAEGTGRRQEGRRSGRGLAALLTIAMIAVITCAACLFVLLKFR